MLTPHERLFHFLKTECIPHTLLFTGPKNVGKKDAAYQFVKQLLNTKKAENNHPDIHLFFPEGKLGLHPIEAIRRLTQNANLAPFEGKWKAFIIHEAEKMLPTSSNALLKTLEDPPHHNVFILLSEHSDRLLPTILSRCFILEFPPGKEKEVDAALLNLLAEGAPKEKVAAFESDRPDTVFETLMLWYRDRFLLEIGEDLGSLHFPHFISQLRKTSFFPLEQVEKAVRQIRLAYERSTKLSTCLDMFFLYLSNSV